MKRHLPANWTVANLKEFTITKEGFEFTSKFGFPNAIKLLEPTAKTISFESMAPYLKYGILR